MRLILPSVPASGALLGVILAGILGNVQRGALALQPTTTIGQDEDPNCRDTMDKCKFWAEIGEVSSVGHRHAYHGIFARARYVQLFAENAHRTRTNIPHSIMPILCNAPHQTQ